MKNFRWNYALPHEEELVRREYTAKMLASFAPPMHAVVDGEGRIFFNDSSHRYGASADGNGYAYAFAEIESGDDVEAITHNVALLFEARYGRPT